MSRARPLNAATSCPRKIPTRPWPRCCPSSPRTERGRNPRYARAPGNILMQQIDRQSAFTGTKEVAPALTFPVDRLEAHLAREVPGFAGPLTVKQFKGGQSNPTYLVESPA